MNAASTRNTVTLSIALLTAGFALVSAPGAHAGTLDGRDKALLQAADRTLRRSRLRACQTGGTTNIIGQAAYEKAVDALAGIVTDPVLNRPTGKESQREAAFRGVNVIYSGVVFGAISIPVAGGALGTGIGVLAGGPPGALAGGLIGGGTGILAGTGEFIGGLVLVSDLTLKINEKYPAVADAGFGLSLAGRRCGQVKAGPWESLTVHMLTVGFNNRVAALGQSWDQMPGITAAQRELLQQARFLQPAVQHAAEVRDTQRIAPNAPEAQPIVSLTEIVERTLSAGAGDEQAWLEAMGIGAMRARIHGGQLRVDMPLVLTAAGAAASYRVNLPSINVKVGGTGGIADPYLRLQMAVGDMDLVLGKAAIVRTGSHAGTIRVSYTLRRGATLGRARLAAKWNGPEGDLDVISPVLTDDLTTDLYFATGPRGLSVRDVVVGTAKIQLAPSHGQSIQIPGFSDLMNQLAGGVQTEIKNAIALPGRWTELLSEIPSYVNTSVGQALNRSAGQYGLVQVTKVNALSIESGRLRATVQGRVLNLGPNPLTVTQVATAFKTRSASPIQRPGARRITRSLADGHNSPF
jgi:hypothetical protein